VRRREEEGRKKERKKTTEKAAVSQKRVRAQLYPLRLLPRVDEVSWLVSDSAVPSRVPESLEVEPPESGIVDVCVAEMDQVSGMTCQSVRLDVRRKGTHRCVKGQKASSCCCGCCR
jgi:hypothetical protein